MKLTFLGTSCMVPTKQRSQPATLLEYNSEYILIDCGEATQRQMKISGLKPTKIRKILITHWHGDHILGLPGLIQTISSSQYDGTLSIFGPVGIKEKIRGMMNIFNFDCELKLDVTEIKDGVFFEDKKYILEAFPLIHRTPCIGYCFIEKDRRRIDLKKIKKLGIPQGPILGKLAENKTTNWKGKKIMPEDVTYVVPGKKVSFIFDTILCENCYKIANNSDVLVSEGVYSEELIEKAKEYYHLTAGQAAEIALKANVKKLIITHISQRYKTPDKIKKDAKSIFENVETADDFMEVEI